MKYGISALTIILGFMLVFGCKKKNTAGPGGDNKLLITVRHHTEVLDSITVYVKYNASDAPSSISEYDMNTKVELINGDTIATIDGLKDGEYYLYGNGWDRKSFLDVEGGLPIELCDETSPIKYNLQVTEEGH